MATTCRVMLLSGSLRARSTNTAVLRTACVVAPEGVEPILYDGLGALPHFNPDLDFPPQPPAVVDLREGIRASDALVFSVPEYAGALPGSFKNLLDWTIGDDRPGSIYEKPVAWINASPRGAASTHRQLQDVLGYAHAEIIEAACTYLPVTSAMVGDDGLLADVPSRSRIAEMLAVVAQHSRTP